jgi:hypothetical protein
VNLVSSRTQFGVSISVWRLVGDNLNITCNFLYCNHQVHRDSSITCRLGLSEYMVLGRILHLERRNCEETGGSHVVSNFTLH